MTQKDKELLLKDLCARLPYKAVAQVSYKDGESWKTEDRKVLGVYTDEQVYVDCVYTNIENTKPYLRPMSSMTKDEEHEFYDICTELSEDKNHFIMEGCIDSNYMLEKFNWLNAHHFDYRGLIERGFALEAPEEMYNIKEK